jgi:hypothetical protein
VQQDRLLDSPGTVVLVAAIAICVVVRMERVVRWHDVCVAATASCLLTTQLMYFGPIFGRRVRMSKRSLSRWEASLLSVQGHGTAVAIRLDIVVVDIVVINDVGDIRLLLLSKVLCRVNNLLSLNLTVAIVMNLGSMLAILGGLVAVELRL